MRGGQQLSSTLPVSAWVAAIEMTKCAMKNHKHQRKCIISASFEEPLLMAATRPFIVMLETNAASSGSDKPQ